MKEKLDYLLKRMKEFHSKYLNEKFIKTFIAPASLENYKLFYTILMESEPPTLSEFIKLTNSGLVISTLIENFDDMVELDIYVSSNDANGWQICGTLHEYSTSTNLIFEY